jgi:hypothetical protein
MAVNRKKGGSISTPDRPKMPASRSDLVARAILYLSAAGLMGVLPSLAAPDLTWCYPFMSPDSWDWLVNGLYWRGAPIDATFRPPGLPLVIALLARLGALPLLPYLNFAMFGLAAILLHRLVRLRHSRLVAALAVLLFVSNGSIFGYVRYVMAEVWTLPLLLGAAIAFARAAERPRRYITCALALSLGFLFQYASVIAGAGLVLALLLFRREALRSRWPWIALLAALPLPATWVLVRLAHARSSAQTHGVEALFRPSFENLGYYGVVALALAGLAALPLYFGGFARLLRRRGEPLSPWAQAVLFPLLAIAFFFVLLYDWPDKRFLYYLFPFAVAVAAEGIAGLIEFGRASRVRAAGAAAALAVMLLGNRIPYPATSHSLLALTPRHFVDAAHDWSHPRPLSVSDRWSLDLLTTDGFFAYRRRRTSCMEPAARAAAPELKRLLDERLHPDEPIALAGDGDNGTLYWIETNKLTIALERPVQKPGATRFLVRRLHVPDSRALATIGPFEVFDLQAVARKKRRHQRWKAQHRQ